MNSRNSEGVGVLLFLSSFSHGFLNISTICSGRSAGTPTPALSNILLWYKETNLARVFCTFLCLLFQLICACSYRAMGCLLITILRVEFHSEVFGGGNSLGTRLQPGLLARWEALTLPGLQRCSQVILGYPSLRSGRTMRCWQSLQSRTTAPWCLCQAPTTKDVSLAVCIQGACKTAICFFNVLFYLLFADILNMFPSGTIHFPPIVELPMPLF